jgi:ElaB/YqjD/DUF883 family membrane-anchored ribosome-binding protein
MGESSDDIRGDSLLGQLDDNVRLRSEIARTREEMSETIDAIQERLNPRNLASQARASVKEATVGRVKQAARSVGQSAAGLADQTRGAAAQVAGSVRDNPWPALLIGAGTAWLFIERSRNGRSSDRSVNVTDYYDYANEDEAVAAMSYEQAVRTRAVYGYDSVEDFRSAQGGLQKASSKARTLFQRNPLAVGAVAAVTGVAIGLAIPETEQERHLMGETRDNLVERAQEAAQGAVEKAKQVVGEAAKQVTGETADRI